MKTEQSSKTSQAKSRRRFWIVGILLGLGGWMGLERATNNDEITQLRYYTPHGSHYIDTALTGGVVSWRSSEIGILKVRKRTREYPSVAEFEAAFQRISPHLKAGISVHHPSLNLEKEDGRQSHDRAEEILTFLAANGYENAGPIAD